MDPEPSSPRWNSTITQGAFGVDGGGSRCRARIEDEFGTVVSEGGCGVHVVNRPDTASYGEAQRTVVTPGKSVAVPNP